MASMERNDYQGRNASPGEKNGVSTLYTTGVYVMMEISRYIFTQLSCHLPALRWTTRMGRKACPRLGHHKIRIVESIQFPGISNSSYITRVIVATMNW